MASELFKKLTGVRDLKKILEITVKDMGEMFRAETFQVMLTNPLDPNVTSICEFRASKDEPQEILPTISLPIVLHGRQLGAMSIARYGEVSADEVNAMRVILGEVSDIIRSAQINEIVQRDTFRETFLVEIGNVMAYSLGIGDALFMVVNILGKVLQASRCLFICTDDTQAGWKCYEYWQQEKVQSCQEYRWPTSDSSLIAQTLLSQAPLHVYEGQTNSYISPVQQELQFIGVKSLVGVPLRSSEATHGCVILQQCDYRRAWTRGEIDMVQNVADKVAEALVKLPAEKRAREPIMQLHQRIVAHPEEEGKIVDAVSVRNALKGALGQQAIPTARKTSAPPPPPPPPKPTPAAPPAPPTPVPPAVQPATAPPVLPAPPATAAPAAAAGGSTSPFANAQQAAAAIAAQQNFAPPPTGETPTISPVQSKSAEHQSALQSATGLAQVPGLNRGADSNGDPYADLDFGDEPTQGKGSRSGADDTWGTLEAMPAGSGGMQSGDVTQPIAPLSPQQVAAAAASAAPTTAPNTPPAVAASAAAPATAPATAPSTGWGDLDSIPTPKAPSTTTGGWGDLDSIPTPGGGGGGSSGGGTATAVAPRAGGLTSMMAGKARATSSSKPFAKSRGAATPPPDGVEAPAAVAVAAPIDDNAAAAKLQAALAAKSASDETADYIFATPGLDPRSAGRISGWIQEIEAKDRYVHGHARQVAELSVAIAREAGLGADVVDQVRLGGLLHDLGKRACPAEVLQKKDEDLSDPELIIMMKHPIDGAELVESFPDLKPLADIIRSHHEEFDGNGYPQGLKGNDIPVAARIVSLANSYHGMVSEMKYGPGMSPTKAQEELVKGAGKQWDPTFVQALIQAIMSKKVPAAF